MHDGELVSDEDLQSVRMEPLAPHDGPVVLSRYDPTWPRLYQREAARLRALLGDQVVSLDHAGSTSVPGLAAKPIIDIVLTVPNSADEAAYVPTLTAAGYRLVIRESDWFEHRLMKGPDTDINLHVFSSGEAEVARMLRFRDRLRTQPSERDLYARTKRSLARRRWRHVQHYAQAKSGIVQEILDRADQ
ncbi:GrpB family protein [Ornithinimicrobium cerasi]|uniref:GrpB domain, predicted nucleotidyltransferase, UPF0157 family n=1 Tax=Ornithinimicrobium cerasi TaxID=2248773 RepID=A0A285VVS9_9MICO|nr:GrpB family protein [Ornithinimicrobium cerasi]SOC57698.1 GrpB domain, predicted nucleotidyltransferase, UPF0157 family [Ornithinimicrobium cerasi]